MAASERNIFLDDAQVFALAEGDLSALMKAAASMRDEGHGDRISYSRKVFIPLTHLCRDSCHYCTFAEAPKRAGRAYMTWEQVEQVVRRGERAGCTEALFTLGDKPELRYRAARDELDALGFESTVSYLRHVSARVLAESSLLPHLNPGVLGLDDYRALRPVSASMGLMLETASARLGERGGPHFGSPDKVPTVRLASIKAAGEANVPFTTGLLIGIGETRAERIESLLALRALHLRYGHIQEIIIQPFRPKANTRMAHRPGASDDELLWTLAICRLLFGSAINVQTPPNLSAELIGDAIDAGINDWGGISPVTADFVNPEAPWPHIEALSEQMRRHGRTLVQRLPLYPEFAGDPKRWLDPKVRTPVLRIQDADGLVPETDWAPGTGGRAAPYRPARTASRDATSLAQIIGQATRGDELTEEEIIRLFAARDQDYLNVCEAADALRASTVGDTIRYVVNRNINYTNVCSYRCAFCAFSKGKGSENLRGAPYDLDRHEIGRRVLEAWERGATEVCMQGGIHPAYTGETYLAILAAVKDVSEGMHVHAFSPLEVSHGARTLGLSVHDYLKRLRDAGLGSLPGTAAEILDDSVRAIICPDKLTTDEWLAVVEAAHRAGLRTTATIMFGHVEAPKHWARHLLHIRRLQKKTGGFTEFVPLPFVHMEAPMYLKGLARRGPTWREAVLMHAVSRLALHPYLPNIQVSWVKMGVEGAAACLRAGANDLGGTLMNESISRAAGAIHGQELTPDRMEELIISLGRKPVQRTSLYDTASTSRRDASFAAPALAGLIQTPAGRSANLTATGLQK